MPEPAPLRRSVLLATVFVTGAEILALEIIGARLISPQFGVSLYVWSALITVTLVALAVGYGLGGWLADRRSAPGDLFLLAVVAALAIAAVPWLAPPVFSLGGRLGLRLGALSGAFLLFTLPLAALAMVTPYAVALLAGRLGRVGTSAGTVYAVSTAGSVVGALTTGFLLVPRLPLDLICELLALTLLLVAALYWLAIRAYWTVALLIALTAAGWWLSLVSGWAVTAQPARGRQLFHGQSLYGELRVVELDEARFLLLNGIIQSGIAADGASIFPYSHLMERLVLDRAATVRRVLLVGLGGGAVARALQRTGQRAQTGGAIVVDVVELDPLIAELAHRYFAYEPGGGELFIEDGRRLLQTLGRSYDAILLDAYAAEAPPAHLLSVEAFRAMRRRLTPDGVVLLNYRELVGDPDAARAAQALARTLRAVFPSVTLYEVESAERLQSRIFVAAMTPAGRPAEAVAMTLAAGPFGGRPITARPRAVGEGGGLILTDLYNPIELLDAPAAEAMRRANRRYLE